MFHDYCVDLYISSSCINAQCLVSALISLRPQVSQTLHTLGWRCGRSTGRHTSAGLTILNVLSSPQTIVAWNALPKRLVTI